MNCSMTWPRSQHWISINFQPKSKIEKGRYCISLINRFFTEHTWKKVTFFHFTFSALFIDRRKVLYSMKMPIYQRKSKSIKIKPFFHYYFYEWPWAKRFWPMAMSFSKEIVSPLSIHHTRLPYCPIRDVWIIAQLAVNFGSETWGDQTQIKAQWGY